MEDHLRAAMYGCSGCAPRSSGGHLSYGLQCGWGSLELCSTQLYQMAWVTLLWVFAAL